MAGSKAEAWWKKHLNPGGRASIPVTERAEADLHLERFQQEAGGSPDWVISPSSSSNPNDPRTAAAAYWKSAQTLQVSWGDGGTPYNYYEVTPSEASGFKKAATYGSPGKYINRRLNSHPYGKAYGD